MEPAQREDRMEQVKEMMRVRRRERSRRSRACVACAMSENKEREGERRLWEWEEAEERRGCRWLSKSSLSMGLGLGLRDGILWVAFYDAEVGGSGKETVLGGHVRLRGGEGSCRWRRMMMERKVHDHVMAMRKSLASNVGTAR